MLACTRSAENSSDGLPPGAVAVTYRNHLYLPVIVDDTLHANFLFDTGADGYHVDKTWVEQNQFKINQRRTAYVLGAGTEKEKIDIILDPHRITTGSLSEETTFLCYPCAPFWADAATG